MTTSKRTAAAEEPTTPKLGRTSTGRATVDGKAALKATDATRYCGFDDRTFFDDHIAPFMPRLDMKPQGGKRNCWRWLVDDLDAFLESRRIPLTLDDQSER